MPNFTKKTAMQMLQILSITSATSAAILGTINLSQQSQNLATLQGIGNFSAFILFTISGMLFDLIQAKKVRPERIVALMGLLLALSFNAAKLMHSSFINQYPSLDSMGLGLTMGIFGLIRHDPTNPTLDLRLSVGRRNVSAYLISALGFGVQIISALALKNAALIPMIEPVVLSTISAVVFSDLHAILPAHQKRTIHAFAYLTAGFTLAAIILFALGQEEFKIFVSALIATLIGMHAFALHNLLSPVSTQAKPSSSPAFCTTLLPQKKQVNSPQLASA